MDHCFKVMSLQWTLKKIKCFLKDGYIYTDRLEDPLSYATAMYSMKYNRGDFYFLSNSKGSIQICCFPSLDFGVVKTTLAECKEKCFKMMSATQAPQNVLVLMIHLRKRSGG